MQFTLFTILALHGFVGPHPEKALFHRPPRYGLGADPSLSSFPGSLSHQCHGRLLDRLLLL